MTSYSIDPKYPDDWDDIRKKVLYRDGYKCCNNLKHSTKPLHVHHIVPISQGGTHNLENLKTICEDCHRKIHPYMEDDLADEYSVEYIESDIFEINIVSDFTLRDELLEDLCKRIMESPVDVRLALKDYEYKADQYQREVIEAEENTIRVLAPAGSGKTQTIINRVIMNIQKGVNPKRILMLTFDNAAVNSINYKMHEQLDSIQKDISSPEIKTLNSFGYNILRENFPGEYKGIIQDYRQRKLFEEAKEGLSKKNQVIHDALPSNLYTNYYLEFFSLLKNETFDPREPKVQQIVDFILNRKESEPLFSDPNNQDLIRKVIQAVVWMYQAYDVVLQNSNYIDFDDQKLRPYILLTKNPIKLTSIRGKYTEIIVDEFQDINKLDFDFIKLLSTEARLIVTGDDDQAIYGFRGCSPEYILNLEESIHRTVVTYKLRSNYRSPSNIVYHSTCLIRNNKWREEKDPIPEIKSTANIKVLSSLSSGLEAKLIVEYIEKIRRENNGLPYSQIAVLYRTNAQSLPLQIEFILNDIPFYVRKENNILTNEILSKLLGLLRVKVALSEGNTPNPSDCVLSVRSYFQFVNNSQKEGLLAHFTLMPNYKLAITTNEFHVILEKAKRSRFNESILKVIEAPTLMETLNVVSSFNGLKGMIGSIEDVLNEQVPLGEIFEIAANFQGNTKEFIETIEQAIEKARITHAGEDNDSGVCLFTYFQSKGLQWHTVILTTCNEGLIPHKRAKIEDERRLFYVAMTRAESNLLISYVNDACGNPVQPSRFINEAKLS